MLRTGIHGMKDMKAPPFGIMLIRTNNTISHKSFVLLTFLIEMYSFSLHFFSIFSCSELKWTVTNSKFVLFADRKGERDTAREKRTKRWNTNCVAGTFQLEVFLIDLRRRDETAHSQRTTCVLSEKLQKAFRMKCKQIN